MFRLSFGFQHDCSHFPISNLLYYATGNLISLISKKNIRYEGVLYSINESDSTLALQNVRSFGTEGREKTEENTTFVAPQDKVHAYLLFRGCDIKDLHVHEAKTKTKEQQKKTAPAPAATDATKAQSAPPKSAPTDTKKNDKESAQQPRSKQGEQGQGGGRGSGNNRRTRKPNPVHQVGTGASLLNRKARGTVAGGEDFFLFESLFLVLLVLSELTTHNVISLFQRS
jgi:protein LSM14